MESSQIKGLFIIVIAALLAIYLGIAAATAQTEAVAWVVGLAGCFGGGAPPPPLSLGVGGGPAAPLQ